MARYLKIEGGVAVNAINVDDPARFPEWTLVQSNSADIGDVWGGATFSKPVGWEAAQAAAAAETARLAEIDQALKADTVAAQIAAMTNAQWDTYWTNRTIAQKDQMQKMLVRAYARSRAL